MPFIIKTTKKSKFEGKSKDELFEIFMFEIGQYTKDEFGNTLITGPYIKSNELFDKFKDWMKKKL